MSRIRKIDHLVRSSGRFMKTLLENPSIKSCIECTHRLILTNVIILRETEKILLRRLYARFSSKSNSRVHRFLLGACFFSWAEDRITDEEMHRSMNEMLGFSSVSLMNNCSELVNCQSSSSNVADEEGVKLFENFSINETPTDTADWEEIVSRNGFRLWRRSLGDGDLYEYRVHGVIKDIPPSAFMAVQLDLRYRRNWDNKVVQLHVVDHDEETNSDVVHWITKFPYPMANREYIYVRRHFFDRQSQSAIIVSRVIPDHPAVSSPDESGVVRVTNYESVMVINAHSQFEEDGFDYHLTYYDDPQASFPGFAYKWMATHGLPAFLDDVHQAAVVLHKEQLTRKEFS